MACPARAARVSDVLRRLALTGVVAALLAACGHDAEGETQPASAAAAPVATTAAVTTSPPAAPSTEAAPPAPPSPADLEQPATLTVADVPVVLGQHDWCYTSGDTVACEAAGALDGCAAPAQPVQVDAGQANVITFPVQPEHVTVSWTLDASGRFADPVGRRRRGRAVRAAGRHRPPVRSVSGPTFSNGYTVCLTVRALS